MSAILCFVCACACAVCSLSLSLLPPLAWISPIKIVVRSVRSNLESHNLEALTLAGPPNPPPSQKVRGLKSPPPLAGPVPLLPCPPPCHWCPALLRSMPMTGAAVSISEREKRTSSGEMRKIFWIVLAIRCAKRDRGKRNRDRQGGGWRREGRCGGRTTKAGGDRYT